MSESATRRYHLRPSWRLLGCALLGLIWGGKAASLLVKYCGSDIESSYGSLGLWSVGIAVALSLTLGLGILIDWAYWSDEVETAEPKQLAE